ncbi:MipA/OmpV family protein [Microvirga sp. W0021]|uniref:MipA/OmpV family protein n=1 Tax=Hohaiivirga grylli TaxID=3133970 RepID=A0ABV0BEU7_9HYPH
MKKRLLGAACLLLTGLAPANVWSQTASTEYSSWTGPWIVTLKGNIGGSPKWSGSDTYTLSGFPSVSLRRPGEKPVWYSPDDSIDYSIKVNDIFSLGAVIAYQGGRYSSGNRELTGIHKVRWTLEPGIFLQAWVVPDVLRVRAEIRRGFRDKDGFIADLGADWVNRFGALTLAVGPRLSIADGSYMRYHYGVTAQDAFQNGTVTPYKATAGLKSAGVLASASYDFDDQWSTTLYGGYSRLVSDAGKSPIVKNHGDRDQWTFGATVGYSFNFSGF